MATRKQIRQVRFGRKGALTLTAPLPNDLDALRERKAVRQKLDLCDELLIVNHPSKTRTFERDFLPLTVKFPTIKLLTLQLLAGAKQMYGSSRSSYTTLQDLYFGIEEFLLSVSGNASLGRSVEAVEDLNVQTAKNFESWLLATYPGRTLNRKRFGKLKTVVEHLQIKCPDVPRIGRTFTWPAGPRSTEAVSEGYPAAVFNALTKACLADIKFVMAAMGSFHETASSTARVVDRDPSLDELIREFGERELKLKSLGKLIETRPSLFENTIRKSPTVVRCIKPLGMTMNEFVALYRRRRDECLGHEKVVSKMRVDSQNSISGYTAEESYKIAMSTINNLYPNWPLAMDYVAANELFSYENTVLTVSSKRIPTAVERKTYRVLNRMKFGYQRTNIEVGVVAYFAHRFFTANTLYPFFLYVQMNTGWNEEVVVSLTDSLDDHVEPDILDPDYVLIYGSKHRVNKAQGCRSSKTNPLSVYRVLRFIESVLHNHRTAINYLPGTLWQFVLHKNLWNKFQRVTKNIENRNIGSISARFLNRHGIVVDPEKKTQRIEARRVRTTYVTRRRESGLSLEEVSPLLGHADISTTDSNYDSDKGSTELKNKRVRELQVRLLDDIKHYRARIVSSKTLSELREAIGAADNSSTNPPAVREVATSLSLTLEQAIHLMSPRGQTYISACIDRREPTWGNARLFVPAGHDCTFFNRCCLCDKSLIFKEALPYIARRVQDIQKLRLVIPSEEWAANYSDEASAWEQILEDWRPIDTVTAAKLACSAQEYSLPLTMRGA